MTTIKSEIRIDAPKRKVWDVISDLGGIQAYHPAVKKSYYITDQRFGRGAARRCEFKQGGSIDERATLWRESDEIVLELYNGKKMPPFKKGVFGRQTLRSDGQGTVIELLLKYDLKYGLVGALMDWFIVRRQFKKMVPAILESLKSLVEDNHRVRVSALMK